MTWIYVSSQNSPMRKVLFIRNFRNTWKLSFRKTKVTPSVSCNEKRVKLCILSRLLNFRVHHFDDYLTILIMLYFALFSCYIVIQAKHDNRHFTRSLTKVKYLPGKTMSQFKNGEIEVERSYILYVSTLMHCSSNSMCSIQGESHSCSMLRFSQLFRW